MFRIIVFLAALIGSLASCAEEPANPAVPGSTSASEPGQGELYVFNDSGWTLVPSDQVLTDNGRELVRLPRQTYVRLTLPPGQHLQKPEPPLWEQEVRLAVKPGQRYIVVVAYKPQRSWLLPFARTPLVLREVGEGAGRGC